MDPQVTMPSTQSAPPSSNTPIPPPSDPSTSAKEFLDALQDKAANVTPKTDPQPTELKKETEPEKPKEPEKKEAAPKEDQFASKFAALTRKERSVYEKEKALKPREERVSKLEKILNEGRKDPGLVLEATGLTLADFAQFAMAKNSGKSDQVQTKEPQAGDEIKKLRAELAEKDRRAAEKEAAEVQQSAINNLASFIKGDSAKYPLCGTFIGEAIPFALDIAWKYRQTYGKDPEVPEVFEKVESVLREQKKTELEHLKGIPLFSDFFKPSQEAPKKNGSNGQGTSTPTKTLTNAPTFSPPEKPNGGFRDENERIRYFASMIKDQ